GTAFENTRVLPRAFAPARVRRVAPPPAAPWPVADAAAAFGPEFSAVTARQDWGATASILAPGPPESVNPTVEIAGYTESTNAARFDARVAGGDNALVVLSLAQDGGWSARDEEDRRLPTFLANGPFFAVEVPPGAHRVRLSYEPPGWRLGWSLSVATTAALAARALARRARSRRA
ncbi:MAG TPA: YfhO family protein, partial [Thermoanaerobaculia bacterium]|nr:YfhO family protein [Thermoanaerobaculia bacterium]